MTGLMLVAALVGASTAISRHRYTDSVQDFAEFLRRTYSSVVSVENERSGPLLSNDLCSISSHRDSKDQDILGTLATNAAGVLETISKQDLKAGLPGRTNCAYYGKLITFGEKDQGATIYAYDLIGRIYEPNLDAPKSDAEAFKDHIKPEAIQIFPDDTGTTCAIRPARQTSYHIQWAGKAETTGQVDPKNQDKSKFTGTIAILRSPETNKIHTVYTTQILEIQSALAAHSSPPSCDQLKSSLATGLSSEFQQASFVHSLDPTANPANHDKFNTLSSDADIDICINSDDAASIGGKRRNIRIHSFAGNSGAIELLPKDTGDNKCQ